MNDQRDDFFAGPSFLHGVLSSYTNRKCRCEACTRAMRVYQMRYLTKLRSLPTPDHRHGTTNGYNNYHCRCDQCRAAHAAYTRAYRKRLKAERQFAKLSDD